MAILPDCMLPDGAEPCNEFKLKQAAEHEAWKEATIAWAVCASIHREYGKSRDALYTTRQANFVRHENECREHALRTKV